MSVNPTNPMSDHLTACQCHPISMAFHSEPQISMRTPHQFLPGLCYCLSYCFTSFLKLLRRRSHVRIVLGRPKNSSNPIGNNNYRVVLAHYIVIAQLVRKKPRILAQICLISPRGLRIDSNLINIAAQLAFIKNYANMETGCHILYKKQNSYLFYLRKIK